MTYERLLSAGFLALSLSSALADTPAAEDCVRLDDDQQRLACYDAAFHRDLVDGLSVPGSGVAAEGAVRAETETTDGTPAVDEFGAEQVEQRIERLEARLAGDFTGWNGSTRFRLDNGQVWQQTRNYIPDYEPREPISQPRVTISRGLMGSYNLQIEGIKRIVQVKRVE